MNVCKAGAFSHMSKQGMEGKELYQQQGAPQQQACIEAEREGLLCNATLKKDRVLFITTTSNRVQK